jgi:hypothetical protein
MPTPISLITTVYNRAPFLPTCLDSILAQTYPHFQLLIWDDGSTDESLPRLGGSRRFPRPHCSAETVAILCKRCRCSFRYWGKNGFGCSGGSIGSVGTGD